LSLWLFLLQKGVPRPFISFLQGPKGVPSALLDGRTFFFPFFLFVWPGRPSPRWARCMVLILAAAGLRELGPAGVLCYVPFSLRPPRRLPDVARRVLFCGLFARSLPGPPATWPIVFFVLVADHPKRTVLVPRRRLPRRFHRNETCLARPLWLVRSQVILARHLTTATTQTRSERNDRFSLRRNVRWHSLPVGKPASDRVNVL